MNFVERDITEVYTVVDMSPKNISKQIKAIMENHDNITSINISSNEIIVNKLEVKN